MVCPPLLLITPACPLDAKIPYPSCRTFDSNIRVNAPPCMSLGPDGVAVRELKFIGGS